MSTANDDQSPDKTEQSSPESSSDSTRRVLPLLPLRDIVVFPHMVVPLFVGRAKSIRALEEAVAGERELLLAAQHEAAKDEPGATDVFTTGTLGSIIQLLKLPDGTVKVLVEGKARAEIKRIAQSEPYFSCEVEVLSEADESTIETEGLVQSMHNVFEDYVKMNKKVAPEMANSVASIEEPSRLADTVIAHLSLDLEEKQRLLEMISPAARLEEVHRLMQSEMEVLEVERKIRGRVKKQMERSQKEYYLNEQMRAIQKELGERDEFKNEITELEEKLDAKEMPEDVRERSRKELRKLKMMSPMSAEATVVRNYIDWVLALPWDHESEDMKDVSQAEAILDEDHFGLEKPKERILEYLAVQQLVERMKGPILCFVGPPGVGKTSLGKSVARATGREFVRISLGGVRDEAEIRGHRRTYIGAMPGKILQSLKRAGTSNPVFLLDEVDKMASDFRGDPSSALLEVLDPEQNSTFNDHYMDMDYDLSKVMFICTANVLHEIPGPLRDRLEVIQIPGYIESEKHSIAESYLVAKQAEQNGLSDKQIQFTKAGLLEIIRHYTRESGVRSLEREIASVCRKVAREFVSQGDNFKNVRVTPTTVNKLLGVQKFRHGRAKEEDRIGVCTGLAFTQVGGELLETEVAVTVGQGKLKVTGRLGEVMQESANAALTYIRSRAKQLGLKQDFYSTLDIHLHVPEGGIPKDGPSAGITIATTLASAITRVPVRSNVAMTGEITLQGRVLPIGGLKEKLIAAHRGGIEKVLIPKENERDLKDVPASILRKLEIVPVEHMDQVLVEALALDDAGSFLKEGAHELGDIYEVGSSVGGKTSGATEVPHPAGVN